MKMKKKLIISLIVLLIIICVGIIIGLNYKNIVYNKNQKRYQEIKEDIQDDIAGYLRVAAPYCSPDSSAQLTITDETLINQRGMDKEELLDVDGESYCKVRVETRCVLENKHEWDTYLSCKDYEDENYSNWEERGRKDN